MAKGGRKARWTSAGRLYSYNANWNGKWTKAQEAVIPQMKNEGHGVSTITDVVFEMGGPARWESVRDKMKEMFPGEHIKGDLDDPLAEREGEISKREERESSTNSQDSQATIPVQLNGSEGRGERVGSTLRDVTNARNA